MSFWNDFDADKAIADNGGDSDFSPLPDGLYLVLVDRAEEKKTKNGNGLMIAVTFKVLDGDHEGRLLWENYNIENPNDTAQKIGRANLGRLIKALGIENPQSVDDLVDRECVVKVSLDKKDPTRNRIVAYLPKGGRVKKVKPKTKADDKPPPWAKQ
jgi:hypothetical protein